jgi:hypothetical protein
VDLEVQDPEQLKNIHKGDRVQVTYMEALAVSSPGKQDGLAWQNGDGTWGGPIGEKIARAIDQGSSCRAR